MQLDSGICKIKRIIDGSDNGSLPVETFETVFESYFGEKTVGVNRYWTAKANDDRIDLFIEIQRYRVRTADRVEIMSFVEPDINGLYKVIAVQHVTDDNGLLMTDLSLERIEGVNEP